jgi:type VI secretion system FHA domain protein
MLAKLKIKHKADPKFKFEKEFNQDTITIGRDAEHSDVHLPGPAISGKHAVIARRGDGFKLSDLSKNGTLLNGGKMKSDKPYDLKHGDRIIVIDYVIEFETRDERLESFSPLLTEIHSEGNPFQDEAKKLTEVFDRIYQKYARADQASRDGFLRSALQGARGHAPDDQMLAIIAEVLQNGKPVSRRRGEISRKETEGLATQFERAFEGDERDAPPESPRKPPAKKPLPVDQSFPGFGSIVFDHPPAPQDSLISSSPAAKVSNLVDRLNLTVDLLLASMVKMIAGRRDFRLTVLEETMMRRKRKKDEPLDFNFCAWEELKEYLHDEMISSKEADQRLAQLKRALNDLMEHQLSLLKGYRRSVGEGSKKLLSALSPAALEAEAGGGILPILTQANLWKFYQSKHQAIVDEISRSFADFERAYFHEAFAVGYKDKDFD